MLKKKAKVTKKRSRGGSAKGSPVTSKRRRFPKLVIEKKPINVYMTYLPGGAVDVQVNSDYVIMTCIYHPDALRANLTDQVQAFMNLVNTGLQEGPPWQELVTEEARKAGVRYMSPDLQRFLERYSNFAYDTFVHMLNYKMHELPELLVELILYRILALMEEDQFYTPLVKSFSRKMWDDLMKQYVNELKEDWLNLRPGPTEGTSKAERAEMLAFYNTSLADCQDAKDIYKRNKTGPWREIIKQRYGGLTEYVESLIDHKPSELAILVTGKHFKKIIGKDFKGVEEVRRQLGIARKEATADVQPEA